MSSIKKYKKSYESPVVQINRRFPFQDAKMRFLIPSSRHLSLIALKLSTTDAQFMTDEKLRSSHLATFVILPALSFFALDFFLSQITDFSTSASDRQGWIIALLLSKRLFLYATALFTVDIASRRSIDVPSALGQVGDII